MNALSHLLVLVSNASLFRKWPKLDTSSERSTRLKGRPARLVVPALLVLMFGGCDGELIRVGFHEARTIIGEGIVTYETILTLQPPASGAFVNVIDLVSTNDPTVWAVLTRERSQDDESSAAFLRLVNSDTGVVLSSQLFRSDLCRYVWPVDIDDDDVFEGLCRGGGFSDVGLFGADGNTVWSFDGGGFFDEGGAPVHLSEGDIDGDGDLEFCIGFSESLGCFDEEGRTLWRVIDGDWYDPVKVVNLGATAAIVLAVRHPRLSARSRRVYYLDVRNGSGELLESRAVPIGYNFDIVQWPPYQEEPSLVTQVGSSLAFRSLDGQPTLEYPIPDALLEFGTRVLGFAVMDAGAQQYLVVNFAAELEHDPRGLGGPRAVRSALVLYNSVGEVVFFDVLDDLVALRSGPLPGTVLVLKGSSVLALVPGELNLRLFPVEAAIVPAPGEKGSARILVPSPG